MERVLALGRGLEVIAAGVGTTAEASRAVLGCAGGQGYRFGQPMPPESFVAATLAL